MGCGGGRGLLRCSLVALALAGAAGAKGQTLEWGPRVGLNASAILYADGGALNGMVPKPGLHLGAMSSLELGRLVALEAAVLFSQDGFHGEGTHPGDFHMDYVDVPVAAKLRLPFWPTLHFLGGLSFGYMIRCRLTDVPIVGGTTCDDRLVGTRWRALDAGALGGLGVRLSTGRGPLEVDLFANVGLRDLKEDLLPPGPARRVALRLSVSWILSARGDA